MAVFSAGPAKRAASCFSYYTSFCQSFSDIIYIGVLFISLTPKKTFFILILFIHITTNDTNKFVKTYFSCRNKQHFDLLTLASTHIIKKLSVPALQTLVQTVPLKSSLWYFQSQFLCMVSAHSKLRKQLDNKFVRTYFIT